MHIAMDPHHWGRGETVDQAKKAMKKHGGSLARYIVYKLPEGVTDAWVGEDGGVYWEWPDGNADRAHSSVPLEVAARRGV